MLSSDITKLFRIVLQCNKEATPHSILKHSKALKPVLSLITDVMTDIISF